MKKRLLSIMMVLTAVLVLGFTGCSNKEKITKTTDNKANVKSEKTIGFVPMTLNNEYFIMMAGAAKEEAQKRGLKIQVQAGAEHGSAEEQLKIVETMIENKVSAICIVPSSSEGLTAAIKRAQDAGIPVINIDTRLDKVLLDKEKCSTVPFIGTDNYAGGKLAGEKAIELFPKGAKTAILNGIEGQQNATDRRGGFYEAIKDKGFKIVAEQTANWDVEAAYKATQNILQGNKDLELIFAANDTMALGAYRAAQEADKNISIIGFDGNTEALNSVLNGGLKATVAQDPVVMGIKGIEAAEKLIKGEKIEDSFNTGAKVVSKDNAKEFIDYFSKYSK